jgi:hypothetical protein
MGHIIDFPEKVFPEWGAIAQELVPYLKNLGATKEEIRQVIDKVRGRWDQIDPPPASDSLPVAFIRKSDEGLPPSTPPFGTRRAHGARHWKLENARTLIALAKFEYQVSSM